MELTVVEICTYGFPLMCNAVSELPFVCGFPWCHGCSALEPCTHCELISERMPYTVRMKNKIKNKAHLTSTLKLFLANDMHMFGYFLH